MSRENVKRFYELAETDKVLAQKLASLDSELSLEASDLANLKDIVNEKIIPLAKEKGLDFTAEEMVEFANEKYMQLSEDDLLEVSGGVSPKTAGLALSSVLLLSLGSAAAINLMNSSHDDVSHVVSEPSKTASEEKDESEDEEALKKSLDEMLKKSPKGADKNANMEDLEKELDNLFKGGKLGGGSAFRPGKGRAAGKNMLNRTIGKKGTSDFDPELNELLKQFQKSIDTDAEGSTDVEKQGAVIGEQLAPTRKQAPVLTTEEQQQTLEETLELRSAPIKETTKPTPISKGTPKKIEKTKDPNETLHKMKYESVSRGATTSWKAIMSHVMGALQEAKYDLSKFNLEAMKKLQNDIDWICGEMKASNGTYYLGASAFLGGAIRSNYGWNTKEPTLENKELEFLQVLKASIYNKDDANVQAALKALSSDEKKEGPVKKHDASGEDQARREREEAEEKARLQVLANKRADDFKEALIEDFKGRAPAKVDDDALRLYAENYLETHDNERDMDYVGMNVVFYATGSGGITEDSSFDVLDVLREANNALPEKNSQFVFESQEAAQKRVDDLASAFKLAVENAFKAKGIKAQLSEKELQQFVSGITDEMKSDTDMKKVAIVGNNTVTFFAKGQLKDGTSVDASQPVNVFELAKELNSMLPSAVEEKKDESAKPQDEIKETVVEKSAAGAKVTTIKELKQQAEAQKKEVETKLTDTFKDKIAANNGLELNEANLNKLISDALNSYKGKENIMVNEKKGTITFTAKGIPKGLILTGADSRSATLNVKDFFTKLNNEAKKVHDVAMKQKIEEKKNAVEKELAEKKFVVSLNKKFVPITEAELQQAHDFFVSELRKGIRKEFEAKIREIYSAQCEVAGIAFDASQGVPTAVAAKIVNDLTKDQKKEIINGVMKDRLTTFQKRGKIKANEQHGVLSWEPAALNDAVKVKVTADVDSFLWGPSSTSKETIVNVRNEIDSLTESYKLKYTDVVDGTVVGKNADKEVEALYKFLTDNKLVENGTVVESVLDTIKDSDKEQFKKDVKHIADQISGSESKYTLSGKWRSYNVAQEKLKAIKDLAGQLGV